MFGTMYNMDEHEVNETIRAFRAEGKSEQWIAGWWRHQEHLADKGVPPIPDFDPDDPRSSLPPEEAMRLLLEPTAPDDSAPARTPQSPGSSS